MIFLVFGVVSALLVSEIFLRLFLPQDLVKPMGAQLDEELIYTLKPDTEAYFKGTSTQMFHLKANSLGIREREIPFQKPDHLFRILLLGDSMSMGEGVELEEIYLKRLEALLETNQIKNVETINAAIRGYGNDQELILFRRMGRRFKPDLVILAFFVYNDMEDNWEAGLFKLREGKLIQQPATVEMSNKYKNYVILSKVHDLPGYLWIMSRSHLANFLRVTYSEMLRGTPLEEKKSETAPSTKTAVEDRAGFYLTLAILEAWKQDVQKIGAKPFLLIIPTYRDPRTLRAIPGADITRLDLALEKFCRREDIPFLNLFHPMVAWEGDFESLWLGCGHFSPKGHAWVARELLNALRSKNLLPQ